MSKYQPFQVKRQCRRAGSAPDGIVMFSCYSFTKTGTTEKHSIELDLKFGPVQCSCGDFRFRHAAHKPDLTQPAHWCKHVARAVAHLVRDKELVLLQDGSARPSDLIYSSPLYVPSSAPMATGADYQDAFADADWWQQWDAAPTS